MYSQVTKNWIIQQSDKEYILQSVSGSLAAFSLSKLSKNAINCIRVRRSLDNTESDIGFSGDALNTSALLTFCNGENGFIVKWYDQSGNGNDLVQSVNTSYQPRIVNAGVIDIHDFRKCIYFDGLNDVLRINSLNLSSTNKMSFLVGFTNKNNTCVILSNGNNATSARSFFITANTYTNIGLNNGAAQYNIYENTFTETNRVILGANIDCTLDETKEIHYFHNRDSMPNYFTHPYTFNVNSNFLNTNLNVGAYWDGSGVPSSMKRIDLDCIIIFNRKLTDNEYIRVLNIIGPGNDGVSIGNSTIAAYAGGKDVPSFIYTDDEGCLNAGVSQLAVPGHTIAQQLTAWNGYKYKKNVKWVITQIGLNDLNPAESAATALLRYQQLIDSIKININTNCKLIVSAMNPCKQRLIDVYGSTNGPISYQKWLDMNDAIMGNGPNAIINVNYRINEHVALLNDGSGNLKAIYDTGDHIHPNDAGRTIVGNSWRNAILHFNLIRH
jgi:hypothetical protein